MLGITHHLRCSVKETVAISLSSKRDPPKRAKGRRDSDLRDFKCGDRVAVRLRIGAFQVAFGLVDRRVVFANLCVDLKMGDCCGELHGNILVCV